MLSTQTSPSRTGDSAAITGNAFVLQFNQGVILGLRGTGGNYSQLDFYCKAEVEVIEKSFQCYLSFSSHLNCFPPPPTQSLTIARNKPH